MEELLLRDAIPSDLPTLKAFEQEIIKAERPFDPTIRPNPVVYYDLEKYVLDDAVKVVVAEHKGQIVASGYALAKTARAYLDHERYAYLGFMYTVPSFRGKGINGKIIELLKDWSRSNGLAEIRLTVYQDNTGAIRAYEKQGFEQHINEMRIRLKIEEP